MDTPKKRRGSTNDTAASPHVKKSRVDATPRKPRAKHEATKKSVQKKLLSSKSLSVITTAPLLICTCATNIKRLTADLHACKPSKGLSHTGTAHIFEAFKKVLEPLEEEVEEPPLAKTDKPTSSVKQVPFVFRFLESKWNRRTFYFQPNFFDYYAEQKKELPHTIYERTFARKGCSGDEFSRDDVRAYCLQRSLGLYRIVFWHEPPWSGDDFSILSDAYGGTVRQRQVVLIDLRAFYTAIGNILTHRVRDRNVVEKILWFVIPALAYCPSKIKNPTPAIGQWCGKDATPQEMLRWMQDEPERRLAPLLQKYGEKMYRSMSRMSNESISSMSNEYVLPLSTVFSNLCSHRYLAERNEENAEALAACLARKNPSAYYVWERRKKRTCEVKEKSDMNRIRKSLWPDFFETNKSIIFEGLRFFPTTQWFNAVAQFLHKSAPSNVRFLSLAQRTFASEEAKKTKAELQKRLDDEFPPLPAVVADVRLDELDDAGFMVPLVD